MYITSFQCAGRYKLNKSTSLSMCGASYLYRGGHGFDSRWGPNIFRASSFQLLKMEHLLRWSLFTFSLTSVSEIYSEKFRLHSDDVNVHWIWTRALIGELAWYVERSHRKTAYHYKLKKNDSRKLFSSKIFRQRSLASWDTDSLHHYNRKRISCFWLLTWRTKVFHVAKNRETAHEKSLTHTVWPNMPCRR